MTAHYPSRIDHGAVETNPLPYRPTDSLRADDYEPGTPEATVDVDWGLSLDQLADLIRAVQKGDAA